MLLNLSHSQSMKKVGVTREQDIYRSIFKNKEEKNRQPDKKCRAHTFVEETSKDG